MTTSPRPGKHAAPRKHAGTRRAAASPRGALSGGGEFGGGESPLSSTVRPGIHTYANFAPHPESRAMAWTALVLALGGLVTVVTGVIAVAVGIVVLTSGRVGKNLAVLAIVLGLVISAGWGYVATVALSPPDDTEVVDPRPDPDYADTSVVGTCFEDPTLEEPADGDVERPRRQRNLAIETDCARMHTFQVIAVTALPDRESYPRDRLLERLAYRACDKAISRDLGKRLDGYAIFYNYPVKNHWKRGDRTLSCIVAKDPKKRGPLVKTAGSLLVTPAETPPVTPVDPSRRAPVNQRDNRGATVVPGHSRDAAYDGSGDLAPVALPGGLARPRRRTPCSGAVRRTNGQKLTVPDRNFGPERSVSPVYR